MKIGGFTIFERNRPIEKREASGFANPAKWLLDILRGEDNAVSATERTTLGLTAAWAAVNLISNTVAGLPVKALKTKGGKRIYLKEHSISKLLASEPNGYMRPFSFKYMMMAKALLKGNAFARIIRDESFTAIGLVPITDNVEVSIVDGKKYYKVDKLDNLLNDMEVFHIMGMTLNGYDGVSVISYHDTTLGLNLSAQKFSHNTYKKGSNLKGYITTPNSMKEAAVNNLKNSWADQYGGPDGKDTAFLDNGLEYKSLSLSMADAQIIETRKYGVEDIARIFSVPPHKIGDLSRSTNNNIEHQSIEFVQDCIMYWAMRWEQECDFKLRTTIEKKRESVYTNFELKGLMRGDAKSRTEFMRGMTEIGALSPNMALELEDMDTFEGGDIRTIQMNRIPINLIEEFTKSIIDKGQQTNNDNTKQ